MDYNKVAYDRARKKVKEIKHFYINLSLYLTIIPVLVFINLYVTPEAYWFQFPMLGWGTGVAVHGMSAHNYIPFLGKNWEEKKLKELIDKEIQKRNYL
jgi:hypothetical protein